MDLENFKLPQETVDVKLVHPTTFETLLNDDGTEMVITMYSPYSAHSKKVERDFMNRKLKVAERKGKITLTADEIAENSLISLAKNTKSWNITVGGEKPECSFDRAKKLYEEIPMIAEQVDEGIANYDFFPKG